MTDRYVVAVIPALDEAGTVGPIVDAVAEHVDDVVLVDDGSNDGTPEIASEHGAIVLRHESSQGYEQTIEDGFERADELDADIVVTIDADGQHDPADLPAMLGPVVSGDYDVIVGKRPTPQRFSEYVYALLASAVIGIDDPMCGLKAYDIDVYRDVGSFDDVGSVGTQLTYEAYVRGYDVGQVDVAMDQREEGRPRLGDLVEANLDILSAAAHMTKFALFSGGRDRDASEDKRQV